MEVPSNDSSDDLRIPEPCQWSDIVRFTADTTHSTESDLSDAQENGYYARNHWHRGVCFDSQGFKWLLLWMELCPLNGVEHVKEGVSPDKAEFKFLSMEMQVTG